MAFQNSAFSYDNSNAYSTVNTTYGFTTNCSKTGNTITTQPKSINNALQLPLNLQSGLEIPPVNLDIFENLGQLLIKQELEVAEILTTYETVNKYQVLDDLSRPVFAAREKSACLQRQLCGGSRSFEIDVTSMGIGSETKILKFKRPFAFNSICLPCCRNQMTIIHPQSNSILGTIFQRWSCIPSFKIYNHQNDHALDIDGQFELLMSLCCNDVDFLIKDKNGVQVGLLQKKWMGFCQEIGTDADNFKIVFPVGMDVKLKAVLLGAVFLVDFMYFENTRN